MVQVQILPILIPLAEILQIRATHNFNMKTIHYTTNTIKIWDIWIKMKREETVILATCNRN